MKTFIEIIFYMLNDVFMSLGEGQNTNLCLFEFLKILQFRDITHDQSKYFHFNLINHRVSHDSCHETFSI